MKKKFLSIMVVLLILGSIMFVLTGCGNDSKSLKENSEKENSSESKKEYSIGDNDSYYVIINGTKFQAGDKISSVSKAGLKLKEKDLDETIPKNRYLLAKSVLNADDKEVCSFVPLNSTDATIKYEDAVIGGFEVGDINYSELSEETLALDVEVAGGIKLGSSLEDVENVLGNDYFKYEQEANESLKMPAYTTYTYSKGYKGYKFIIDDSGKVSEISWHNYSYDE